MAEVNAVVEFSDGLIGVGMFSGIEYKSPQLSAVAMKNISYITVDDEGIDFVHSEETALHIVSPSSVTLI